MFRYVRAEVHESMEFIYVGSLQSECPASRRLRQYLVALCQPMRLPLSLAAHMSPVEGSVQYPRA